MSESMIELAIPFLPALAFGWCLGVTSDGIAAPSEKPTDIAVSLLVWAAGTAACEAAGFVACRWAYRTFLMLL